MQQQAPMANMGLTIVMNRMSHGSWGIELQRGSTSRSVQVSGVLPESPAEIAGLVTGDDIIAIDGTPVTQMIGRVSAVLSGNMTTQVTLQVIPHQAVTKKAALYPSDGDVVRLKFFRNNEKSKWGLKFQFNQYIGLIIVNAAKGGAAAKAGCIPGDKVISIGGNLVNGQVASANQMLQATNDCEFVVQRREVWASRVATPGAMVPPPYQGQAMQEKGGFPPQQGYPPQQQGYPPQQQGYPQQQEPPPGYPPQTQPPGYPAQPVFQQNQFPQSTTPDDTNAIYEEIAPNVVPNTNPQAGYLEVQPTSDQQTLI